MPSQAQIDRAGRLAADVRFTKKRPPVLEAFVPSSRNPDISYRVTHGPLDGWRCPCMWRTQTGEECAHMLAVWARLDEDGQDHTDYITEEQT